jgi:hypothetical protein
MYFDLVKHTILLTLAGSRAYGIHRADSDVDVKGIAIPPMETYLGLNHAFEQADSPDNIAAFLPLLSDEEREISHREKLEGSVYELRKFMSLAADANPNILDVLFCDDAHVRVCSKEGRELRDNGNLFLSAKAKHTFSGYSAAQFKRIKTHRSYLLNPPKGPPTREEFDLPAVGLIPKNQLEAAVASIQKKTDEWETDLSAVTSEADRISILGKINLMLAEIMSTTDSKWKSAARSIGYDENFIHLLEKERRFRHAQDDWSRYHQWKKARNPARAALEEKYGYDTKHASHLVRLMRMCREILVDGKVNVNRVGIDSDELVAIRAGAWSYDKLEEFFLTEDALCTEIYNTKKYSIPHKPDMKRIEELCISILSKRIDI